MALRMSKFAFGFPLFYAQRKSSKHKILQFFYNYREEIPESFYSSETGEPYRECSLCGTELREGMYFIEKAFQRTHDKTEFKVVFEYALCESCKNGMMTNISKESMKNIQNFAMSMDTALFQDREEFDPQMGYMLTHCLATGKSIDELDEYHLIGIFDGDKIIQLPMVYGESFIEEYSELLSEETKGFFDDFFDHITIIPPALAKVLEDEKPKKRPVLI